MLLAIVACSSAQAQFLGKKTPPQQEKPNFMRLYIVDIPRTDDMIFNNVLPSTHKIIGVGDINGEGQFLLVNAAAFDTIQALFKGYKEQYAISKNALSDRFIGMDVSVSYIGKLSLVSEKEIRNMNNEDKELARTLNAYEKFTLIGESPKPILMRRTTAGKFVPDFNSPLSSSGNEARTKPGNNSQNNTPPSNESPFFEELRRKGKL